jgi:hypothetical protein
VAQPDEAVGQDEAALGELPDVEVTPEAMMAKLTTCTRKASRAPFAKDAAGRAEIHVCQLKNAVFFNADLDVDCDGKQSPACNLQTDPSYQSQTAGVDSTGKPLDAAALPYIVVPGASSKWNFNNSGIAMGTVGAVIYNGKIQYGIVGDIGPKTIIGEASYAMARDVGINPNPSTGGIGSGVTYVIFTGPTAKVTKNEDHAEAVMVGKRRAAQMLAEN